jgi:hypothetical protein
MLQVVPQLLLADDIRDLSGSTEKVEILANNAIGLRTGLDASTKGVIVKIVIGFIKLIA